MVSVAFGCVTNSLQRVQRYVLPSIGQWSLALLWNQRSMSAAYNHLLRSHTTRPPREQPGALILIHDDLEITDPDAVAKVLDVFLDPEVAIVGVAGGSYAAGLAWWNADHIGHQRTDWGLLDFGPRSGDVETVEGSFMAFSPWAIRNLRFDEEFSGFHGYDHIGAVALDAGKRVVVADIDTHHHTFLGFDDEANAQAWATGDMMFRRKWNGRIGS